MANYIIRLNDSEDKESVSVSIESDGLHLAEENSKAFQLSAYALDCIQSLEEKAKNATH